MIYRYVVSTGLSWLGDKGAFSVTRRGDIELSVVCETTNVPLDMVAERMACATSSGAS